jgi:hypothetical protein
MRAGNIPLRTVALAALALMLFACAGEPPQKTERPAPALPPPQKPREYRITGYKGGADGGEIPGWAARYLEGGNAAVEALDEFQGRRVFVAHIRGSNFKALEQWNSFFSAELDFPRLAALRLEQRFTEAAGGFPDTAYGSYFETMIRAASDAEWHGPVREDDFWLARAYTDQAPETGGTETGEGYDFMILVTIEKDLLASQIQALLGSLNPQPPPTKDQAAAAERVRDQLFSESEL